LAKKNNSEITELTTKTNKQKNTASKKTTAKKKASVKKKVSQKKAVSKKTAAKKAVKKTSKKNTPKTQKKELNKQENFLEKTSDADVDLRGDNPMTVVEHLDEFRSRILYILIFLIAITVGALYFSDIILEQLNAPFKETVGKLNIFSIAEPFMLKLKAAGIVGLMLTLPVILFQVWRFISPAVGKEDRWFGRISFVFALLLFYIGVSVVYFGLLPMVIKVLQSMVTENMQQVQGASNYLSFLFMFSFAMGVLFELPIIATILTKIGILTPQFLIVKRKYAIVAIWIIAAIITPADPLSQVLVAIPLMFLYELSILLSKAIIYRKRKKGLID